MLSRPSTVSVEVQCCVMLSYSAARWFHVLASAGGRHIEDGEAQGNGGRVKENLVVQHFRLGPGFFLFCLAAFSCTVVAVHLRRKSWW